MVVMVVSQARSSENKLFMHVSSWNNHVHVWDNFGWIWSDLVLVIEKNPLWKSLAFIFQQFQMRANFGYITITIYTTVVARVWIQSLRSFSFALQLYDTKCWLRFKFRFFTYLSFWTVKNTWITKRVVTVKMHSGWIGIKFTIKWKICFWITILKNYLELFKYFVFLTLQGINDVLSSHKYTGLKISPSFMSW